MIRQGLNGFLMALADSVPGVSGGTVAFIMGFYDNFIGAIDDLMRGNHVQKIWQSSESAGQSAWCWRC